MKLSKVLRRRAGGYQEEKEGSRSRSARKRGHLEIRGNRRNKGEEEQEEDS